MKSATSSLRGNFRKHHAYSEAGTGLVGTMFGALVFLSFVALATHTMVGLYATSVVKSVVWEQASAVAVDPSTLNETDADLHQRLSGMTLISRDWDLSNPDVVQLRVQVKRPSLLPSSLAKQTSLTTIDQSAVVRREVKR